jgi:hypothetical protein
MLRTILVSAAVLLGVVAAGPLGSATNYSCTATVDVPSCSFTCDPTVAAGVFVIVDGSGLVDGNASCPGGGTRCVGVDSCDGWNRYTNSGTGSCHLAFGSTARCGLSSGPP